jgi:biotin carboxylase
MGTHVLIVGNGREIPGLVRRARPDIRTTMLVRLGVLHRVREREANARIIGLPHGQGAEEWIAVARAIHDRDPFDHLGTYSEKDQDKAAAIGAALGLPTHSVDTVRWVHDKVAMRERLAAAGVDPTPGVRVKTAQDIRDVADRYGYPVVVKPVAGAASSGVSVVRAADQIDAAWAWARAAEEPDTDEVTVEPFLAGLECSVEAFSEDGRHRVVCVTGKVKDPVHCVELGHVVRGPFEPATRDLVAAYTGRVLDALGVRDGVTHTEVILTAAGPRVVETHLRPAGDDIPEMIRDTYRVDLIDLLVRRSLGESVLDRLDRELAAAEHVGQYAAIWYASPAAAGEIIAVSGVQASAELPGVVSVEVLKEVGDRLPAEVTDSRERAVAARAVADSPAEALRRARAAAEAVTFTVRARPAFETVPVPDCDRW